MNNDASTSSAPPPRRASAPEPTRQNTGLEQDGNTTEGTGAAREQPPLIQSPAQKRLELQTKKKYDFVNSLTTNIDTIIYVELCILYYMDCSFFRLLIRFVNQMVFLSPKPAFIPPMPQRRPYLGALFGPNIICMLLHVFTARSEAGEAMRGYLHGGIIIDLIGQKGPTSKIHLVLLDALVLVLQCCMLSVVVEKQRLSTILSALSKPSSSTDQSTIQIVPAQDLDAEERGVVGAVTNVEDIEMQRLGSRIDAPSMRDNEQDGNLERGRLLDEHPQEEPDDDNPLDMLFTGTAIVAEFHVLDTLRKQWADYGNATSSALQTAGFSAGFAATTANRRINAATQTLQRGVESLRG
ncbi:hypothetical protein B0O99DRAFT_499125 [Bisporella sp. PMI_857]|nr:hypothetical protein B0O99DRAFT_499125 [Bisporella sp. PMI_857]